MRQLLKRLLRQIPPIYWLLQKLYRLVRCNPMPRSMRSPRGLLDNARVSHAYKRSIKQAKLWQRSQDASAAAVIHLYYLESWPLFEKHLEKLRETIAFDLYLTLPEENLSYIATVKNKFPDVRTFVAPNRGRDILPFVKLLPILHTMGYDYLLKMHSKKSTHRTDGMKWLEDMTTSLIPTDKEMVQDLVRILESNNTGMVGPEKQYMSLKVNFDANGNDLTRIVKRIVGTSRTYDALQTHREDYGFFGGSMFWAPIDVLHSVIEHNDGVRLYDLESGQIDGTYAHAMERAFCVMSELYGRDMYEIRKSGIRSIPYNSGIVPDWSAVYIGPKPN